MSSQVILGYSGRLLANGSPGVKLCFSGSAYQDSGTNILRYCISAVHTTIDSLDVKIAGLSVHVPIH